MRIAFTLTWKVVVGALFAAVFLALAVSWSGLVSIAASSGHFAPVEWFLHWTMRNAVATQSAAIELPEDVDLSDASLVQRAAGHFATGCAPCHGAPGV
ncbi:MAG: cytochrome C, partial [Rhizobiaceae bacterium]|nr:cytochrome C [Rhizobiaceae bacterium]